MRDSLIEQREGWVPDDRWRNGYRSIDNWQKKKKEMAGVGHHIILQKLGWLLLQGFTVQACLHACLSFLSISPIYMELWKTNIIMHWDSLSVTGIHCTNLHMPLSCHTKGAQSEMHSTQKGGGRVLTNHRNLCHLFLPIKCLIIKALVLCWDWIKINEIELIVLLDTFTVRFSSTSVLASRNEV